MRGQDPQFSQFYANQLYLAPSFAGATEDYRFALNWRNQWPSIPGVFHTYSVSFDKALPNFNSGIGILATYDV
ncbi:MAG: type IX secretion system membrane protein PorP/SprF, partial [Bacteroidales bacterium]|nr:type IX secretion system membrane protein PorP/SprF [Bacteroidales bacterium]